MSRFAQWRYTSVAVMMLVACRGRSASDKVSDSASSSAMADSVAATVVAADSTTAVAPTTAVATGTGGISIDPRHAGWIQLQVERICRVICLKFAEAHGEIIQQTLNINSAAHWHKGA